MSNDLQENLQPIAPHPMSDRITQEHLSVLADAPGVGNGSHHYIVKDVAGHVVLDLKFQHGALQEVGLNGVLTGTLLQIMVHHLKGFQAGPYPSRETAVVITKLEEALQWSKQRELERALRNVLGTAAK